MKRQSLAVFVAMAAAVLFAACSNPAPRESSDMASDPTEKLPEKYKTQDEVQEPDFEEAAKSPAFQDAIHEASALLGAQAQPLISPGERGEVAGGVSFEVPAKKIGSILLETHKRFFEKGSYLFRYEQNFGLNDRPDRVGLLPTTDKYAVMAAMETNGDNYNIGTSGVIAWMKDLEKDHPFILTGIGFDYMEGHLADPVTDSKSLAQRMYEFCPDIVDQGVGDEDKLAAELEEGRLYFWWD